MVVSVRQAVSASIAAAVLFLGILPGWLPPLQAQTAGDNPLLLDIAPNPVAAYDFESENLNGDTIRLSRYRGKVVFLNFWATWCVPCLVEMPAMDRLNRIMEGKPFVMLAINQAESPERIEAFFKRRRFNFSFEIVLDRLGEIGGIYGVDRLPLSYIIDDKGFVIRRAIGAREWDSQDAIDLFERLIAAIPGAGESGTVREARRGAPGKAPSAVVEVRD